MSPTPVHDSLLLFGATGDLSQRYLLPSLVHLLRDRLLPPSFRLVAVGRQEFDAPAFAAWMREQMRGEYERWRDAFEDLIARTTYVAVDLADPDAMAERLRGFADRPAVSYLAIPPVLFEPTCRGLQAAGLLAEPSRLVLEKPIGHDLASSRAINATLRGFLDETRIFRIDHYLGKAPVQNHMLQLLALIAMEPPGALDAESLRDEKRKVLKALRPMTAEDVVSNSVRGRYQAGVVDGRAVAGFDHPSDAETFVGLRAHIDNWRWSGVPFRLVTGKRLAQRTTQVLVSFKPVSHWLFDKPPHSGAMPNRLLMQLQPEFDILLGLMGSLAAPEWSGTELQPLAMDLSMPTPQRRIAYERLLLDALHGNQALFVTGEEVEAAWAWIDSISAAWTAAATPALAYPAGSWGPAEAADFLPIGVVGGKRGRRTS